MKKIFIALLLSLSLGACAGFQPMQEIEVPSSLSQAGKEAAKLINEAKVALISANQTIASQASAGLMLKADAVKYAALVDKYWLQVKEAEKILAGGDEVLAKNKAELLSSLILALQKEVLARQKKGA